MRNVVPPFRRSLARPRLLALTLMSLACGTEAALGPVGDRVLPTELRLQAQAAGVDAGKDISCSLDTHLRLDGAVDRSTHRVVQHGTGGGDAQRGWEVPAGNGVGFWAELFIADLEAHLIGADSVELRSPLGMAVTDPLTGELARGVWICRPMDTPPSSGEYFDNVGTVAGSWTLRAAP
jgi:hypothetical protein